MFGEEVPYYEINHEYSESEKRYLWDIGMGLQQVDNLVPSAYFVNLVEEEIAGRTSYQDISEKISSFYKVNKNPDQEEADVVSLRITQFLADNISFKLSPATLLGIHHFLFCDVSIFQFPVGKFRETNISKSEKVLNNESIVYDSHFMILTTLQYDFEQEKQINYESFSLQEKAYKAMDFISNIWQIHPFREGNTRTCAVFAILYLRELGFTVNNKPFRDHSQYFSDCLVAANAPEKLKLTNI